MREYNYDVFQEFINQNVPYQYSLSIILGYDNRSYGDIHREMYDCMDKADAELYDKLFENNECIYCKDNAFNVLIESDKIGNMIYWIISKAGKITNDDIEMCMQDNCVVFDMRNGSGYLRLGDPHEMGCIDHSLNFKVDNCPMCGRKLK